MGKKIVDAKGMACPQPVLLTKKALLEITTGEEIVVLVDNEVSKSNVEHFCISKNCAVDISTDNGVFRITVKKGGDGTLTKQEGHSRHETTEKAKHVIAITSNRMGHGSDALGEILIRAFINSIQEITPLPETIVLYNSGIEFALHGSPVLESLLELEKRGVAIVVCGTCVQHFNQKDNVAVGTISNMYTILEILSRAGHVVTP